MVGVSYDYTKAETAKYLQLNVGTWYNLSKRTLLYATTSWESGPQASIPPASPPLPRCHS
jgi:hypothetical protein